MTEGTEAQLDGMIVTVVDLSTIGAHILCPTPLKPLQQVQMVLADDLGVVKCSAAVAWAFFEIPKGVSRYRAGVEFKNAEGKAVNAFCRRHELRQIWARCHYVAPTPNHSAAADFSRTIVSLRPEPVDTIDTGSPVVSSRNAIYRCASRGKSS